VGRVEGWNETRGGGECMISFGLKVASHRVCCAACAHVAVIFQPYTHQPAPVVHHRGSQRHRLPGEGPEREEAQVPPPSNAARQPICCGHVPHPHARKPGKRDRVHEQAGAQTPVCMQWGSGSQWMVLQQLHIENGLQDGLGALPQSAVATALTAPCPRLTSA